MRNDDARDGFEAKRFMSLQVRTGELTRWKLFAIERDVSLSHLVRSAVRAHLARDGADELRR